MTKKSGRARRTAYDRTTADGEEDTRRTANEDRLKRRATTTTKEHEDNGQVKATTSSHGQHSPANDDHGWMTRDDTERRPLTADRSHGLRAVTDDDDGQLDRRLDGIQRRIRMAGEEARRRMTTTTEDDLVSGWLRTTTTGKLTTAIYGPATTTVDKAGDGGREGWDGHEDVGAVHPILLAHRLSAHPRGKMSPTRRASEDGGDGRAAASHPPLSRPGASTFDRGGHRRRPAANRQTRADALVLLFSHSVFKARESG